MTNSFDEKMDKGSTMAEMWEGFFNKTIPNVAIDSPQYRDMMTAFYAGGLCFFN